MLYELTTMTRAFREASDLKTLERIRKGNLVAPSKIIQGYPRGLELIITKALRRDSETRFHDADTMRREIEALGHRQKLVMGDSAIAEVMAQLFENIEPWRGDRAESNAANDAVMQAIPAEISASATVPVDAMPPTIIRNLRAATELADQMVIEVHTDAAEAALDAAVDAAIESVATTSPSPLDGQEPEGNPTAPLPASSVTLAPASPPPLTGRPPASPPPLTGRPPASPPPRAGRSLASRPPSTLPPISTDARPAATLLGTPAVSAAPAKPVTRRRPWMSMIAGIVTLAGATGLALAINAVAPADEEAPAPAPAPAPIAAAIAARPAPAPVHVAPAPTPTPPPAPEPPPPPTEIHIKVTTTPADATVLIDGQRLGHTPYEGTVPAATGSHTLKIRRRGYTTLKFEVDLDTDLVREVTLQPTAMDAGPARGDTASSTPARRLPRHRPRSAT